MAEHIIIAVWSMTSLVLPAIICLAWFAFFEPEPDQSGDEHG